MALILPFSALVILATALPFALARLLPEGVAGLVLNGAVSAIAMICVGAGYFSWAYLRQDGRVLDALGLASGETLVHFLRLGFGAALIWGPVLVLALGAQPRRWKEVQW